MSKRAFLTNARTTRDAINGESSDRRVMNSKLCLAVCTALAWTVGILDASAQQPNAQHIQLIRDTAALICNTVNDAKGQKSEAQIQGDVKAQLSGLAGKVAEAGGSGKGSLTREEFEGLSREATATALSDDRNCRERVFNKMFETLTYYPPPPIGPPEDTRPQHLQHVPGIPLAMAARVIKPDYFTVINLFIENTSPDTDIEFAFGPGKPGS